MQRRESFSGMGAALALGTLGPQGAAGQTGAHLAGNGFVTLRPREDADRRTENRFAVCDPFGNEIDQTGTRTQGLQEAINYCARHGYGLLVIGGANATGDPAAAASPPPSSSKLGRKTAAAFSTVQIPGNG